MTLAEPGLGELAPIRAAANADHSWIARAVRANPVVIAGAGQLGRRVLTGLRRVGIDPLAFADNNESLWGSRVEGIQVSSVADAALRFGASAIFLVATWRPVRSGGVADFERQLRGKGCRNVLPFSKIFWAFPEIFPEYYLWDHPLRIENAWPEIERAYSSMSDERSRAVFAAQLALRASADFGALPAIESHAQYFPEFLERDPDEHFVDCGAYDGDTIAEFLDWASGRFVRITAIEADPSCYRELLRFVASRPELTGKVVCRQSAVTSRSGSIRFDASGKTSAAISESGDTEIRAVKLDDILETAPTFIKMDIEGAELDALAGAAETIRRHAPVLAVCVYHAQDHLWRVPLAIHEMYPAARLFLRSYRLDGLETVCYAVPPGRVRKEAR